MPAKLPGKNANDLPSATWVPGVETGRQQEPTYPGIPKQSLLCHEYRFKVAEHSFQVPIPNSP